MKKCYEIKAKGNRKAEIYVYARIGETFFDIGVTAQGFVKELNSLGKLDEINLRIDSEGGSPFDAMTMYNALRRNGARIVADVDGKAWSAASLLLMAGDVRRMASNTSLMIHQPSGQLGFATAQEHREFADRLDMVKRLMVETYVRATGLEEKRVNEIVDAETWMNAEEAVESGFIHEVSDEMKMAACVAPEMIATYKNVPDWVRNSVKAATDFAPTPNPKLQHMRAKLNAQRL